MTARHAGYLVVLREDVREDDAAAVMTALQVITGVVSVQPVEADSYQAIAYARYWTPEARAKALAENEQAAADMAAKRERWRRIQARLADCGFSGTGRSDLNVQLNPEAWEALLDRLDQAVTPEGLANRLLGRAGSIIFTSWGDRPLSSGELARTIREETANLACLACADTGRIVQLYPDSVPEPWRPGSYAEGAVRPCPACSAGLEVTP